MLKHIFEHNSARNLPEGATSCKQAGIDAMYWHIPSLNVRIAEKLVAVAPKNGSNFRPEKRVMFLTPKCRHAELGAFGCFSNINDLLWFVDILLGCLAGITQREV